jgi:hypothetical protein
VADRYLLETSATDGYLLEDGAGVLLLEVPPIAYDSFSSSAAGTGTLSWTHTPVGTPRGVLVFIVQAGSADQISAVTYGGVSLGRVAFLSHPTAVFSAVYAYFLGASIPTGPQTVEVTVTGGNTRRAGAFAVVAPTDTAVVDFETILSDSLADPSTVLGVTGRTVWAAISFYSGQDAVTGITPLTDWTDTLEHNFFGSESCGWYRYNISDTADVTAGWTQTADSVAAIAVALAEVAVGAVEVLPGTGAATWEGFAPTVAVSNHQTVLAGVGQATWEGFAATVQVGVNVSPGVGAATWTGFAPSVTTSNHQTVTPGVGTATWDGFAPSVTTSNHQTVAAGLGQATWAGFAPTIAIGIHVQAQTGAAVWAGFAPTVQTPVNLAAGTGVGTWTGFAPSMQIGVTVGAGLGQATWSGFAPGITVSEHQLVSAGRGEATWTGFAPSVRTPVTVGAGLGAASWHGFAPTVDITSPQQTVDAITRSTSSSAFGAGSTGTVAY